ncbi:MAG: alginate export family protein [Sedimentisphaerales bacterium]|jgi:hypothetical protein
MAQNGTKVILASVFLLAGLLVAAQIQAAEPPAGASPTDVQATDWFHNPAPWLEQGADFRFREHYGYNWTALNDDLTDPKGNNAADWHFERYRSRWWTSIKADDNTSINTRFTWEFRTYDKPDSAAQATDFDEIIMDNLNLSMKNFLDLPATAIIGRQDIKLGEGWLVFDGTPVDGSRTFYFDAARFTFDLGEKTKLDTIYVSNMPKSDWWLKPINDRNKIVTQEEEQGAIVYLTDKSNENMQVEGYFMFKNNNPVDNIARGFITSAAKLAQYSKKAEIYTFGGAISGRLSENWNYRVEGAVQTGRSASPNTALTANTETEDLLAFGEKSTLEYSFKDDLDNKLHVTYEYLSGDDPGTKRVEAFNPLWGQWPQWSEFYQPYVTQMEDALVSNIHRLDFGHKFKPNKEWEILTDWNLLWANENTFAGNPKFTEDGNFRGHLLTCWARYNFTKQLKGNLVGEYFMPGNYYSSTNNDNALYFHFTIEYTF